MKWLYLLVATAILPLAAVQLYNSFGVIMGWWFAGDGGLRELLAWGLGLGTLSLGGFLRAWWLFRRPRVFVGFPVITHDGPEGA